MENNLIPTQNLPPFLKFCCTVGILPTSYKISWTYEEQVLECIRFIKEKVIPVVNKNALATTELQEKFVELVNYVETYLENLDVQEEINNKLDEMAESGELVEIIAQYLELQGLLCYNTVNDLKNADNLTNGSFTKTYGKIFYNDGMGAFYKIRTIINTDIIDNENIIALTNYPELVAEKIQEIKDKINVKLFGIEGNNTDITQNLQNLINKLGAQTYFFPNGEYYFKNILLPNNTKIEGENLTKFIIPTNEEIASLFILENKENITFENVYLQNAENPNTTQLYGGLLENYKCCIVLKNCNNIKIDNCYFNKFYYGLNILSSQNIEIKNSKFEKSGYVMIMCSNESDNIKINNCKFDTCYSNLENNNTYMVAFTSFGFEDNTTFPENIEITNCTFKNNEYWEGIDTHGAKNITILNCSFENIKDSISLFNDERFLLRNLNMENIRIENCTIKSSILNSSGILVSGAQNVIPVSKGLMVKNVIIKNNIIETTNIDNDNRYALYLHYIENLNVENNIIKSQNKCLRTHMVIYGNISNNILESQNTAPLVIYYTHLVDIINNKIKLLGENTESAGTFGDGVANVYMEGNISNNTDLFMRRYGAANVFATFGKPLIDYTTMRNTNEIVTSKRVSRNSSSASTPACTLTGTNGSNIITSSVNILTVASILQNIKINNSLDTYIKEYIDEYHFKIATPLLSDITNVNFTLTPRTFA